jgi:hypothetical protein
MSLKEANGHLDPEQIFIGTVHFCHPYAVLLFCRSKEHDG